MSFVECVQFTYRLNIYVISTDPNNPVLFSLQYFYHPSSYSKLETRESLLILLPSHFISNQPVFLIKSSKCLINVYNSYGLIISMDPDIQSVETRTQVFLILGPAFSSIFYDAFREGALF